MQKNASTFLRSVMRFAVLLVGLSSAESRTFAAPLSVSPISTNFVGRGILGSIGLQSWEMFQGNSPRLGRVLRHTEEAILRPPCRRLWMRMHLAGNSRQAAEHLVQAVERRCPGWQSHLWTAFRGGSSVLRAAAVELLPLVLRARALPILSEALRSSSSSLRGAAARGMVRLGRAAVPELERLMPDTFEAARALAEIGDKDAIAALTRSWQWIRDPFAARFLPDRERRSWYLLRLGAGPRRLFGPTGPSLKFLLSLLQISTDPAAAAFCIAGLSRPAGSPFDRNRFDALRLLAAMKSRDSATVLATFLRAPTSQQRDVAARGLGRLGGPEVVSVLAMELVPRIPARFLRAVEALALTNRAEAVAALLPHIKWTGDIGRSAILALGVLVRDKARFLQGPGAVVLRDKTLRLLRGLARAKGDPRRWWALGALGLARDRDAMSQGLVLTRSSQPTEALAGCMALDGQGGRRRVASRLVSLLDSSDERLAACAAWVLRDSHEQAALTRALWDPRPMVSRNAAAALAQGEFSLSVLKKSAQSLDRVVQTAGLVALARRRALPFARLAGAFVHAEEARSVLLAALIARDRDRARRFLRSLAWRFDRFGVQQPGWLFRARLEVAGKVFHRSEENFIVLTLSGRPVGGRPVLIRPRDGLPVWWFAGPDGLLLRTGLPAGPLDVKMGAATGIASRSDAGDVMARPGGKAGGKFRGH